MLGSPPPGYNAPAINRQNVGAFNQTLGFAGGAAGFNPSTLSSSYAAPSSAAYPSSFPTQNQYYANAGGPNPQARMSHALMNGKGRVF